MFFIFTRIVFFFCISIKFVYYFIYNLFCFFFCSSGIIYLSVHRPFFLFWCQLNGLWNTHIHISMVTSQWGTVILYHLTKENCAKRGRKTQQSVLKLIHFIYSPERESFMPPTHSLCILDFLHGWHSIFLKI